MSGNICCSFYLLYYVVELVWLKKQKQTDSTSCDGCPLSLIFCAHPLALPPPSKEEIQIMNDLSSLLGPTLPRQNSQLPSQVQNGPSQEELDIQRRYGTVREQIVLLKNSVTHRWWWESKSQGLKITKKLLKIVALGQRLYGCNFQ